MTGSVAARGWLSAAALVGLFHLGCSASVSTAETAGADGVTRRDTEIRHEDCPLDAGGAEQLDANADGRADITLVKSGAREVCRAIDFNFDGRIDTFVYRDASGQVRRRESDYDTDGRIDEVSIYKGGVIVEKHRATTLSGRLDTWHFFKGGKISKTERDSDGDAVIDQWWEYPTAGKPECPLIHSDVDGDGKPDPGATVDVCASGEGYVPPAAPKPAESAPAFQAPPGSDVPVELENKGGDTGGGEAGGSEEKSE